MKKQNKIILALDATDRKKALEVCEQAAKYVDAIKVGYPLILAVGLDFIGELRRFGKPIIADLKVADIPEISRKICQQAVKKGADYVIIHGFVGEDVVKACSEVAEIFIVTEMSHPGANDFMATSSEEIGRMARKHAYGIVAPATRPEKIKKLREIVGGLVIISPGVKTQGAEVGDAIMAGADFEIVGRGIYQAEDPGKAAKEFSEAVRKL